MENFQIPTWLDDSFLKQVLQSKEGSPKIEVLKWTCKSAVPPGSNYSSLLYGVDVDYKKGTEGTTCSTKLIVKTAPDFKAAIGFLEIFVAMAFNKETLMYKEVLPKMKQLQSWEGSPRVFDCSRESTLVLEDLREQGYNMVDRLKLLDLAHCKHAVQSLAQLHALSVAVNHSNPDTIKAAGVPGFYQENSPTKDQEDMMFKMLHLGMLETVKTLPGCERYVELVGKSIESFYNKMVQLFKPTSNGLNVLCHGDMWINNMLYKYNDSGEIVGVKMIDFQQIKYCSFAHDLLYFWFSSANEEVREHYREEIFELYRVNLNQMLEKLKCKERLSKEEFDREIKTWAPQSLQTASSLLTLALVEPDDVMDMSKLNLGDATKSGKAPTPEEMAAMAQQAMAAAATKNFNSKYYKAALPKVLKEMEELGAFL